MDFKLDEALYYAGRRLRVAGVMALEGASGQKTTRYVVEDESAAPLLLDTILGGFRRAMVVHVQDVGRIAAASYADDAFDRSEPCGVDEPPAIRDVGFEDGMKVRRVEL